MLSSVFNDTEAMDQCLDNRHWYTFLCSSVVTWFAALLLVLTGRFLSICVCKKNGTQTSDTEIGWLGEAKSWAFEVVSGQTTTGRILVVLDFIWSIYALIIYFIDTTGEVETCDIWAHSTTQQVDLGCNIFFLKYFFIRLLAAPNKLTFLMEIYTLVDFFTIPPFFLSIYLDRNWLGLRWTRALRLMQLPDVLQYLNIVITYNGVVLCQLVSTMVSVWFSAAGCLHLVENSGDVFNNFENASAKTYWECVYFLLLTMSTVGYGEVFCETTLGKIFVVFFVLGATAMFTSFMPAIMEICGSSSKDVSSSKKDNKKKRRISSKKPEEQWLLNSGIEETETETQNTTKTQRNKARKLKMRSFRICGRQSITEVNKKSFARCRCRCRCSLNATHNYRQASEFRWRLMTSPVQCPCGIHVYRKKQKC